MWHSSAMGVRGDCSAQGNGGAVGVDAGPSLALTQDE